MKHHCPMCGEQWDDDKCASCGWFEGKKPSYSAPRRKLTRKQKLAYQQRGASMRAMDRQLSAFSRAVDSGELVITPILPSVSEAGYSSADPLRPDGEIQSTEPLSGHGRED
jgi:hypothetical protein